MTPAELHALTELVTQFRKRAETAAELSETHKTLSQHRDPLGFAAYHRTRGKASAYADAATELERVLREAENA